MTNYVSAYNFMDLLKDKGVAPQTDLTTTNWVSKFMGLFGQLSSTIEQTGSQYNFMDLLQDKGFIPALEVSQLLVPSNDNDLQVQVA